MHKSVTQNSEEDRSAGSVGGAFAPVSSLRPRRREPVIQVFSQRPAAAHGAAEESDLDEGVSSLGSLSIRLLAEWSKPRMMLPSSWEADDGSAR